MAQTRPEITLEYIGGMKQLRRVAGLPEARERLGIKPLSLGSFSEGCRVFEPLKLQQVIDELARDLRPVDRHDLLKQLPGKLTLVDATVIQTLCTVSEAMFLPLAEGGHSHAWRLHLQFDVDHHVPAQWEITAVGDHRAAEHRQERREERAASQAGRRAYVRDGSLVRPVCAVERHQRAGSSYVCRVRDNSVYDLCEDRPLTPATREAGVLSDQVVQMGLSKRPDQRADHPTRLICIRCSAHQKRTQAVHHGRSKRSGPTSDGVLRITTDLLDVPAEVIAFLYQYRWMIEVFFRFFKQILGCRHLLSTKQEGSRSRSTPPSSAVC